MANTKSFCVKPVWAKSFCCVPENLLHQFRPLDFKEQCYLVKKKHMKLLLSLLNKNNAWKQTAVRRVIELIWLLSRVNSWICFTFASNLNFSRKTIEKAAYHWLYSLKLGIKYHSQKNFIFLNQRSNWKNIKWLLQGKFMHLNFITVQSCNCLQLLFSSLKIHQVTNAGTAIQSIAMHSLKCHITIKKTNNRTYDSKYVEEKLSRAT